MANPEEEGGGNFFSQNERKSGKMHFLTKFFGIIAKENRAPLSECAGVLINVTVVHNKFIP